MNIMDNNKCKNDLEINEGMLPIVEKMADSMPGGFFVYHAENDEKLIYYNKSMLRIFGCETGGEFEELTHNSFKGIVHPDDLDTVENSIKEQILNSKYDMDYVEYRIIKKDGTIRWIEDYGHFIHTSAYGDVFYVFVEDATERMEKRMAELEEMNEELKNAYDRESQYKKAIIQNAASFFEVDLSRDSFMNSAFQNADGKAVDIFESINMPHTTKYSEYVQMQAKLMDEDEMADYIQFFDINRLIRCYHKGELEQVYETWITDALGRRRLVHYAIWLGRQEYTGDIIALSVCTDITDQMERQNLLQIALKQAQSANIARSAFLENMSHDIRTPLNAIVGYADLITNCSDNVKVLDYAQKIKNSGSQLMSIVYESLEVTRAESGKAVLTEAACNIDDIINEITEEVSPAMDKKNLDFTVDFDNIRHRYIYADIVRLKEIISQLLDNSLKYTDAGGCVRLTVREESNAVQGYAQFVFIVQDNGVGILDGFKENLFQAFEREKNTTMSKVPGTGLGLTVVKTFVDMMEGTVSVDSESGKGSTFTVKILFKLSGEGKDEAQAKELDRSALTGKRILLAEDNELNAEIAAELLAQCGFIVETADNGLAALEKVKNSSGGYYSAVLMDIQMPVMDGYEAARQIRGLENSTLANIPIVALSANVFPEDRQKSFEAGMDAHFSKPIEINNLIGLLCRVLAKVT